MFQISAVTQASSVTDAFAVSNSFVTDAFAVSNSFVTDASAVTDVYTVTDASAVRHVKRHDFCNIYLQLYVH